jgi:hypothetical protein
MSRRLPRRITHEGKSVATPRWTDDNMLQYSLNAKVNSAIFLGGDAPPRERGSSALFKVAVGYAERRAGVSGGGTRGRAQRRRQVAGAGA